MIRDIMAGFVKVAAVSDIPAGSGKVVEVPVKRILQGEPADEVVSRGSLADPAAIDWFIAYAAELQRQTPALLIRKRGGKLTKQPGLLRRSEYAGNGE